MLQSVRCSTKMERHDRGKRTYGVAANSLVAQESWRQPSSMDISNPQRSHQCVTGKRPALLGRNRISDGVKVE
ncbi:hypothetical protein EVAR_36334_1 [Eumeta japonica]|uniref:Uncharacterized protein n=1 Tax=Eumeta variegata TaxID=151549 RepID=A0A4C1W497_EUMVA|nr:hypothetical protein EVAR_36334_1 [Eumeta japonica]